MKSNRTIEDVLNSLKQRGFGRRYLEPKMGYASKGLDQAVTNANKSGGNEELLNKLLFIEELILKGSISAGKDGSILKEDDQLNSNSSIPDNIQDESLEQIASKLLAMAGSVKRISDNLNAAEPSESGKGTRTRIDDIRAAKHKRDMGKKGKA